MSWLKQAFIDLAVRARALFRRSAQRDRLDEEMRMHLRLRADQFVAAGQSPEEARRQARREFGNIAALRDSAADMWRFGSLDRLMQDVRFAGRTMVRTPGFAAAVIAILAIGIGVNAAVFSAANALFLRRLPVPDASRVVLVYSNNFSNTGLREYWEYRDHNATLQGLAASQSIAAGLRIGTESDRASGQMVSGNYFPVLGIRAVQGRMLEPADDRPGAEPVVVLSHRAWQRRFASAPVVGRTVVINERTFTIVGIMEPGFTGNAAFLPIEFAVPMSADALLRPTLSPEARIASGSVQMIGRMRDGISRRQVLADLSVIGQRLRAAAGTPPSRDPVVSVYPAFVINPEALLPAGVFLLLLTVIGGVVLLIACINVANLVLARSAARETEFAVRRSMGAGRGRLIRQILTENGLLCAAAGACGLGIAGGLLRLLRTLAVIQVPLAPSFDLEIPLDWHVAVYLAAAVFAVTVLVGMTPALTVSRSDLTGALKGAVTGLRHARTRRRFLMAQVSLSVLLLVLAGLFVSALQAAGRMELGFEPDGVMTASLDLEARGFTAERGTAFVRDLQDRLLASPGIEAANAVELVPLALSNRAQHFLRAGEAPPGPDANAATPLVYMNVVTPGHFGTLKIDLVAGRDFARVDDERAPRVAVVNQTLARMFWPGQSAIGQRIRPDGESGAWMEVVGIVKDSKYVTVGEDPKPFLYQPFAQAYSPHPVLLVRGSGPTASTVQTIRDVVRSLDPGLPVFDVMTLDTATAASLLPLKVAGRLLAILGVFALTLSVVGTYSVLSYLVRSRSRELAIRLAIGAPPKNLAWMVFRQALGATATGTAVGLAAAALVSGLLRSLLFGVSPYDGWTYTLVPLAIFCAAAVAAAVPARSATRQDPIAALRQV